MDFLKEVNKYKSSAISFLQKLVQINSVLDESTKTCEMPFGSGINKCLEYILEDAKLSGFKTINDDGYCGCIVLNEEAKESIGILGHLDVVPVDNTWNYPPFGGVIHNNKMYGRGTMDDKGPVVACYFALKILKDLNIKLNKKIELILGLDEETNWRGIKHYQKNYEMPKIGFSPDAKFPLINGEKGILHIVIKSNKLKDYTLVGGKIFNAVIPSAYCLLKENYEKEYLSFLKEHNLEGNVSFKDGLYKYTLIGKTAHAMNPELGINAGTYLALFLNNQIKCPLLKFISDYVHNSFNLSKLGFKCNHEVMGSLTNNVGIINIDEDNAYFTFDIRYPVNFDFSIFEDAFKNILAIYGLTYEVVENKKPHYVDALDPLVTTLLSTYQKYTNDLESKPLSIGGGTYARCLSHGVAFGMEMPHDISVAHMSDEYIDLDDFILSIAIYIEAIYQLGK